MLNSRKSFSTFSPHNKKGKSPQRRNTMMNGDVLESMDDRENNKNGANERRYSLRSPATKRSVYDESNTSNLLNLSDYVADRFEESCFSIHSEDGKTEKKNDRRDTFEGTIDLNTSNTSNFSFSAANERRNTVDQNDLSAMMRDLEDSEDEGNSQLQISISTTGSTVQGMNILDVTGESEIAAPSNNKRRRSSISSLGRSEGVPESDFMFSPARSTRSRSSRPQTPAKPAPSPQSSSALRRSARFPAKSARDTDPDETSVASNRKSPRAVMRAAKAATPNFLDTTNSFSVSNVSVAATPNFLDTTNTLPEDASVVCESEELQQSRMADLLGLDEVDLYGADEEVDLRSAKKDARRTTVDTVDMMALMGELDDSHNASLDASRVSHASTGDNESVSSVNTMELNLKIHAIMGNTPAQSAPSSPGSVVSHTSTASSLRLDDAHSQASTANLSDLSIFSTSSRASKKGRGSVSKSPSLKSLAVKSPVQKSPAQKSSVGSSVKSSSKKQAKTPEPELTLTTEEVSVQLDQSVSVSVTPTITPAVVNRRDTIDANEMGSFLDQSLSGMQSVASEARGTRRNTIDPADMLSLLDSSELEDSTHHSHTHSVSKARRNTIDANDLLSLMDSSDLMSPAQDARRTTMDAADMSALLNDSTEAATVEREEEKEVPDMLDDSTTGFGSFAGRESIDMSVLQEMVANRLNDDYSSAPSPAASIASSISFSVFSSRQGGDRRDTVDPNAILGLLEDEASVTMSVADTSVQALSTSNLSAHSRSFTKTPLHTIASSVTVLPVAQEEDLTEELSDDNRSDQGTVNAADMDLLNDTMSTNQSFQTVATLDLQMLVEHQIEESVHYSDGESDAGSEMTSDTIGTLAGFLDLSDGAIQAIQEEAEERAKITAASIVASQSPATSVAVFQVADSPVREGSPASVLSTTSSVRSTDRFNRPKVPTSPAPRMPASPASNRSSGSRRSRSSLGSSDTPDSFDHTAELSVRSVAGNKMKVFGTKGRASLSTSVVLERPAQLRNSLRRASVGPIATSSTVVPLAASPATKTRTSKAPVPTPSPVPITRALNASALNDSSVQSSVQSSVPPSVLKSCLSSRKISRPGHLRFQPDSALKRNVVFGSPQACEFNKTSPTTNFTPLHKDHAKSLFSMEVAGEEAVESPDSETEANDEVMDQWERLTNASEGGSSDDEPCEEFVDEGMDGNDYFSFASRGRRGSVGGRRRDSKRMPSINLTDADSSSEGSVNISRESLQPVPYAGSEPAELSISAEDSYDEPYVIQMEPLDASVNMSSEDATGTVCLPGSLAELVAQTAAASMAVPAVIPAPVVSNVNSSTLSENEASRTEEIEVDLQALMRKMDRSHYRADASAVEHADADQSMLSTNSDAYSRYSDAGSQRMSILEGIDLSGGDLSVSMRAEDEALGALIGRQSDASTIQTLNTSELNTSVRSTRSTRSGASHASASVAASVDSKASKASKGSKKGSGKKGKKTTESPAAAGMSQMELSTYSDASVLEMSSFAEDNTYQLEGTLANMVNALTAQAAVPTSDVNTSVASHKDANTSHASSVHSRSGLQSLEMSSFAEDNTYQLEGSLAAMINTLAPSTPAASVASPWQSSEQEISVIEGGNQGLAEGEEMECDFSALESPRPSGVGIAAHRSLDDSALDTSVLSSSGVKDVSGNSRVMRRSNGSTSSRRSGSIFNNLSTQSDLTHETFGEFSLLASEQEEERIRALAAGVTTTTTVPSNSIMNRLQNLNRGARSNSLLQAGIPVIRPEQSRMSIGFKRQSMAGNLNSSLNMSVMAPVQAKSAVKSAKKRRHEPLVVEPVSPVFEAVESFEVENILSPTPSMAKVYGGPSSPTLQYSTNPLRLKSTPARQIEVVEEMDVSVSVHEVSSEVSVLNTTVETLTDYAPLVANLRAKLLSFFSAVQTIKTVLSTYSPEVRTIVQNSMVAHIEGAYADSPLQHVPLEGLVHAWTLTATQAAEYVQYVLERYPTCHHKQRMSHPDLHHDQLWVNMCAKTLIDHTGALQRAHEAHAQAQSGDRFYNKALNRATSSTNSASSDFSALLTAQQAEVAAQVKRDLSETDVLISIVNKFTYCQVTCFTSSVVRISANLSSTVTAELEFQLQRTTSAGESVLSIQNILVDLSIKQDSRTPQATNVQNLFATAYFASVMCNDELDGPLSQKTLLAAAEPNDIPALLHKVSGSIAELRWALLRLSTLSGDGYKVIVAKPLGGGFNAVITVPLRGVLSVSVRDFVHACRIPHTTGIDGAVTREDNDEKITDEEREELLSQLQARLDSCLTR